MLERFDNRRRCAIRVLAETLPPYKRQVYDPCCGSAGIFVMFVQSGKFIESHGGRTGDIAVYGQESNSTTRGLTIFLLEQATI
jgi:type I restriction enzyme M protein